MEHPAPPRVARRAARSVHVVHAARLPGSPRRAARRPAVDRRAPELRLYDAGDGAHLHAALAAPRRSRFRVYNAGMIGIIGGTGLYALPGLVEQEWRHIESPFGEPSDELLFGRLGEHRVVFLPRHGRGHRIPPHEIPFRANIDALKRAGVTTRGLDQRRRLAARRARAGHVRAGRSVHRSHAARPQDVLRHRLRRPRLDGAPDLRARCAASSRRPAPRSASPVAVGGTYVAMEGPQFSSAAESEMHRMLGCAGGRHDQHARGQARPRGGAVLRDRRDGHRLRLLAPRSRPRRGRARRQGAARQRRPRARPDRRRGAPARRAASRRARTAAIARSTPRS